MSVVVGFGMVRVYQMKYEEVDILKFFFFNVSGFLYMLMFLLGIICGCMIFVFFQFSLVFIYVLLCFFFKLVYEGCIFVVNMDVIEVFFSFGSFLKGVI